MNGPRPICAGCQKPTTWTKPVCDDCMRAVGETPTQYCPLCESVMLLANTQLLKADKFGVHYTKTGGYAGKCSAGNPGGNSSG